MKFPGIISLMPSEHIPHWRKPPSQMNDPVLHTNFYHFLWFGTSAYYWGMETSVFAPLGCLQSEQVVYGWGRLSLVICLYSLCLCNCLPACQLVQAKYFSLSMLGIKVVALPTCYWAGELSLCLSHLSFLSTSWNKWRMFFHLLQGMLPTGFLALLTHHG